MKVLHNNVLVTSAEVEQKSQGGIILSSDISTGNKPAIVIAFGDSVTCLKQENKVYLDWSKSMPVEIDGLKCAVVDIEHIKLIVE